jgi:hypothetical protein
MEKIFEIRTLIHHLFVLKFGSLVGRSVPMVLIAPATIIREIMMILNLAVASAM